MPRDVSLSDLEAVAFIFARGGSKGIPNKNLSLLDGQSLLQRAIKIAKACKYVRAVVVSTDDPGIAAEAVKSDAKVPFLRPRELSTDESLEWFAWQHAVSATMESGLMTSSDVFLSVPVTSPFRQVNDLENNIEALVKNEADLVISVTPSKKNPMFNMVHMQEDGFVRLLMQPSEVIPGRQFGESPVYDITTVAYATTPDYVLSASSLFDGKVYATVVPEYRALDIDTQLDLSFANFLINQQTLNEKNG